MIKRDIFVRAVTVLHEEIRQQAQLEYYMAEYFDVDSSELQSKYEDSSHSVLMQLLSRLVDDDGTMMDWLYDDYDRQKGLFRSVPTPCDIELEMEIKTAKDLYTYFRYLKANANDRCKICRTFFKKYRPKCEEEI